ncbi:MAG: hypothetical protein K1060chlam1_00699 [Candidatus Anoxychlamydiales bacterium]|nr:hypothetical protein [Candidatus Anoxychlamydiales bacterium]
MSTPVDKKNDSIDLFFNYFTEKPRDLFRALNNIFFGNKHLIGKETRAISKGLKNFTRAADIFAMADFLASLNAIRNHFNGKKVVTKKIKKLVLASDTANSVAESTAWLSTTGVLSLSAYASSWVMSLSGITLMLSFATRSYKDIQKLKKPHPNEPEELKQRKITMCNLAKDISFFALGVILFTSGWFGFVLNIAALTIASSSAIISSFASYYIKNRKEDAKKVDTASTPLPVVDPNAVPVTS